MYVAQPRARAALPNSPMNSGSSLGTSSIAAADYLFEELEGGNASDVPALHSLASAAEPAQEANDVTQPEKSQTLPRSVVGQCKDAARVRQTRECLRLMSEHKHSVKQHELILMAQIASTAAAASGAWQDCLAAANHLLQASGASGIREEAITRRGEAAAPPGNVVVARQVVSHAFSSVCRRKNWEAAAAILLFASQSATLRPLISAGKVAICCRIVCDSVGKDDSAKERALSVANKIFDAYVTNITARIVQKEPVQSEVVMVHNAMAALMGHFGDVQGALELLKVSLVSRCALLFGELSAPCCDVGSAITLAGMIADASSSALQQELVELSLTIGEGCLLPPSDLHLIRLSLDLMDALIALVNASHDMQIPSPWLAENMLRAHVLGQRGSAVKSSTKVLAGFARLATRAGDGIPANVRLPRSVAQCLGIVMDADGADASTIQVVYTICSREKLLHSFAPADRTAFVRRQQAMRYVFVLAKAFQSHVDQPFVKKLTDFALSIYGERDYSQLSFAAYASLLHHVGKDTSLLSAWDKFKSATERKKSRYNERRTEGTSPDDNREEMQPPRLNEAEAGDAAHFPLPLRHTVLLAALRERKARLAELLLHDFLADVTNLLERHEDVTTVVGGRSLMSWSLMCREELAQNVANLKASDASTRK